MTVHDDPIRLRLLKGLTAVLEGVTIANGYKHDLAGKVLRGRLTYGEKDPLPMIGIIEPPVLLRSEAKPEFATSDVDVYKLVLQGFAKDDARHPTDPAYRLLADVRRAIGLEIERMQRYPDTAFGIARRRFTDVGMDRGAVRPSDEISSKAYFWLTVRFNFAEDYLNPYGD